MRLKIRTSSAQKLHKKIFAKQLLEFRICRFVRADRAAESGADGFIFRASVVMVDSSGCGRVSSIEGERAKLARNPNLFAEENSDAPPRNPNVTNKHQRVQI